MKAKLKYNLRENFFIVLSIGCLCTTHSFALEPIPGQAPTYHCDSSRLTSAQDQFCSGEQLLAQGSADQASFALERAVLDNPKDANARYALAEAYYDMRLPDLARKQLLQARRLHPDADLTLKINSFLAEINAKFPKIKPRAWFTLGLFGGYDSNVNAATTNTSVILTGVGVTPLSPVERALSSAFVQPLISFGGLVPFAGGSLSGQATADLESNPDAHEFDYNRYIGQAIYRNDGDKWFFSVPTLFEYDTLQNDPFLSISSGALELGRHISGLTDVSGFVGIDNYIYPTDITQTGNLYVTGFTWEHVFPDFMIRTKLMPFYGRRDINSEYFKYNERNIYGAGIYNEYLGFKRIVPFINFSYQRSNYLEPNPNIAPGIVTQQDNYYIFSVGNTWYMTKRFSAIIEFRYLQNTSTLSVFRFNEKLGRIGLIYHFAAPN